MLFGNQSGESKCMSEKRRNAVTFAPLAPFGPSVTSFCRFSGTFCWHLGPVSPTCIFRAPLNAPAMSTTHFNLFGVWEEARAEPLCALRVSGAAAGVSLM